MLGSPTGLMSKGFIISSVSHFWHHHPTKKRLGTPSDQLPSFVPIKSSRRAAKGFSPFPPAAAKGLAPGAKGLAPAPGAPAGFWSRWGEGKKYLGGEIWMHNFDMSTVYCILYVYIHIYNLYIYIFMILSCDVMCVFQS